MSRVIQHASRALEYLPEQDLIWRCVAAMALSDAHALNGEMTAAYLAQLEALAAIKSAGNIYFLIVVNLKLANILRQRGRLQRTVEICQQQMQLSRETGLSQMGVVGLLCAIWGEALAELNDLDAALDLARKGVAIPAPGGDVAMIGWSYLCLMRVLYSRGDVAGAEEIIRKMEKISRESGLPPWVTNQVATWQTRLWLAQDKLEATSQWVEARGLGVVEESKPLHVLDYFRLDEYVVLARILLAQGRLDETIGLLQWLLKAAETGDRISKAIEILLIEALTFQAGGDASRAMAALERALALAEPGGFVRIFVDEGSPMAQLLYKAVTRGIAPDHARRLLSAFPATEPEKTKAPKVELIEPLSEREIEVLQLIAEGLSNREIASRIFVSLNTIKVHTRNIYGKLDVHNRTQAVARARTLGVLPST